MNKKGRNVPVIVLLVFVIVLLAALVILFYDKFEKLTSRDKESATGENNPPFIGKWEVIEISTYDDTSKTFGDISETRGTDTYLEYKKDGKKCAEWSGSRCSSYEKYEVEGNIIKKKDDGASYPIEKWKMLGEDNLEIIIETPEESGYAPFLKYKAERVK